MIKRQKGWGEGGREEEEEEEEGGGEAKGGCWQTRWRGASADIRPTDSSVLWPLRFDADNFYHMLDSLQSSVWRFGRINLSPGVQQCTKQELMKMPRKDGEGVGRRWGCMCVCVCVCGGGGGSRDRKEEGGKLFVYQVMQTTL